MLATHNVGSGRLL
jgi:hypothetical protein